MKFFSYINGVSYVFEGYMVNEFTYSVQCSPAQIVPFGEARNATYQSCALAGNKQGSLSVRGSDYLSASFGYSHTHLWRNIGIVIAFTVLYIILTIIASELLPFVGDGGGATVFAPTRKAKRALRQAEARRDDTEANAVKGSKTGDQLDLVATRSTSDRTARASNSEDERKRRRDLEQKSIFTWKDINYTIDGHYLLNNIYGYVKPGEMTVCSLCLNYLHYEMIYIFMQALMGASGAGKTTVRWHDGSVIRSIVANSVPAAAHYIVTTPKQRNYHWRNVGRWQAS
jgi:ATP-binding cassette, subfamily G (WHITE), member 2, SNQ2